MKYPLHTLYVAAPCIVSIWTRRIVVTERICVYSHGHQPMISFLKILLNFMAKMYVVKSSVMVDTYRLCSIYNAYWESKVLLSYVHKLIRVPIVNVHTLNSFIVIRAHPSINSVYSPLTHLYIYSLYTPNTDAVQNRVPVSMV